MAAQTFTNFPRLPPEIRTQIWKAAIRPDRPGVHYFEIRKFRNPNDDDDDPNTLDLPGSELFAGPGRDIWTTNPEEDPEQNDQRSDFCRIQRAKASAYLWDAGLWSASAESRKTIREHVDFVRFGNIALYFEPERHPYHYIRVDAKEDLFVLELGKPFPIMDDWDTTVRDKPCLDLDGCRSDSPGLAHAQVAFEFDQKWLEYLPKDSSEAKVQNGPPSYSDQILLFETEPCQAFLTFAGSWNWAGEISQLWLIDRNFKRHRESTRPPARFYGQNTSYHRIRANEVSPSDKNAFKFLRSLEKILELHMPGEQNVKDGPRFSAVGVLECRDL